MGHVETFGPGLEQDFPAYFTTKTTRRTRQQAHPGVLLFREKIL